MTAALAMELPARVAAGELVVLFGELSQVFIIARPVTVISFNVPTHAFVVVRPTHKSTSKDCPASPRKRARADSSPINYQSRWLTKRCFGLGSHGGGIGCCDSRSLSSFVNRGTGRRTGVGSLTAGSELTYDLFECTRLCFSRGSLLALLYTWLP